MDPTGGYSGTPLIRKLGIKPGFRLLVVNGPANYTELLGELPTEAMVVTTPQEVEFIHLFAADAAMLEEHLDKLIEWLIPTGMLWISWPKGASGLQTDLNRERVRERVLQTDLVDTKVCSIDETWSALKFMIRRDRR